MTFGYVVEDVRWAHLERSIPMKRLLTSLLLGTCVAASPAPAFAEYPAKAVKVVVPFPPGTPPDIIGRLAVQKMAAGLGQPLVVENRPGAAGTIGAEAVAKSPTDGYTLLLGTTGSLASAPTLYPRVGYDAVTSFAPISRLSNSVFLVVVHASLGANSLKDLIEVAKAKPGQLAFGSGGNGNPIHIAGEMFKAAAGVDLLHVPYGSQSSPFQDFAAGRTHVMVEQLPSLYSYIRSGDLRALAIAGPKRLAQLPDVPTVAEAGLPGYEVSVWTGLLAPGGTPGAVVRRLNAEVQKALASAELQEAFMRLGIEPAGNTPEDFAELIRADSAKWSRAIKLSGAKLD
jgi:tripartite-type tricarboxylate transporter receptor subunit TctC